MACSNHSANKSLTMTDCCDTTEMELTFLGTGTSTGIPQIGCGCKVCRSTDVRDKRLRCSAMVKIGNRNLLIDCGPDFRMQMLRQGSPSLDTLLVTHSHYDHLGGLDDLRPYCHRENGFPIYCREDIARDIHVRMPYCFGEERYPGAPVININIIDREPFMIEDIEIEPLEVFHCDNYVINGFRIGPLSYITDCKTMPEETIDKIRGTEVLVLNALRFREHRSHLSLDEALRLVERIKPHHTYLTHFSHDIGLHQDLQSLLPERITAAFDGLSVKIPLR